MTSYLSAHMHAALSKHSVCLVDLSICLANAETVIAMFTEDLRDPAFGLL